MLEPFRFKDFRQAIRFIARNVPFAGPNDDAHVIVFPHGSGIVFAGKYSYGHVEVKRRQS